MKQIYDPLETKNKLKGRYLANSITPQSHSPRRSQSCTKRTHLVYKFCHSRNLQSLKHAPQHPHLSHPISKPDQTTTMHLTTSSTHQPSTINHQKIPSSRILRLKLKTPPTSHPTTPTLYPRTNPPSPPSLYLLAPPATFAPKLPANSVTKHPFYNSPP